MSTVARPEQPGHHQSARPDPDGRLAVLLAGAAIGAIVGLVAAAIAFRSWAGMGSLATAAVSSVGAVAGGAFAVVALAIRARVRADPGRDGFG